MNYNNKDIFLQRATANQTFEEYALRMQPNGVVVSDAAGNLAVVPSSEASPTSSWALMAITASTALNSVSASYAVSASYEIVFETSASHAEEADYAMEALSASYALQANSALSAISASHAHTSSEAGIATTLRLNSSAFGEYIVGLYGSNAGVVYPVGESYGVFVYDIQNQILKVPTSFTTASWATSSISASYALQSLSASWAPMPTVSNSSSWASSSVSASYATYAATAANATSASYAPTPTLVTSASLAASSISASYVSSVSKIIGDLNTIVRVPTMSIDFNVAMFHSSSLTASMYLTASNLGVGKMASLKLNASASANWNIYYPSQWVWLGTAPTVVSASKVAVISLTAFGNADSDIVGSFAMQG